MATTRTPGKVRCPACGAKNDGIRCRICGADLRDDVERPLTQPVPGSAQMRSARLSGIFLIAIGGVLLIGLLALVLGVVSGPRWLTTIRNKIPLISQESEDGWTSFTEPEARFAAEMPVDREKVTVPLGASLTGQADQWKAGLGGTSTVPDTVLTITWAPVAPVTDDSIEATLTSTAEQWGAELGGRVETNEEMTFQGLPARRVKVTRLEQGDEVASVDAIVVRRREQLVIIASRSVYPDHPQFSRLANGFSFL
jgi:hypothetical protein